MPVRIFLLTINDLINESLYYLQQAQIETSKFEMRLLVAFVLNTDVNTLMFYRQELTDKQITEFRRLVELRKNHCPIDKIIGTKGFYKYDFKVSEDVLSPRADTEILVENAIALIKQNNFSNILELGVGSGCIILSILADCPNAKGVGIDISSKALNVAKQNAESIGVNKRLSLRQGSWFDDNIAMLTGDHFDIIISNPPYIPTKDIETLDIEVKNFDPITALDGGADGLRDYRQICKSAINLLNDDGYLIFEAGINQSDDIKRIASENDFTTVAILKDLGGIDRCVILKKQFTL